MIRSNEKEDNRPRGNAYSGLSPTHPYTRCSLFRTLPLSLPCPSPILHLSLVPIFSLPLPYPFSLFPFPFPVPNLSPFLRIRTQMALVGEHSWAVRTRTVLQLETTPCRRRKLSGEYLCGGGGGCACVRWVWVGVCWCVDGCACVCDGEAVGTSAWVCVCERSWC